MWEEAAEGAQREKIQILIFNWLDSTEVSWDADGGKTVIFLGFFALLYIYFSTGYWTFSLGCIRLIPLDLFVTYKIGQKCVIHTYTYILQSYFEEEKYPKGNIKPLISGTADINAPCVSLVEHTLCLDQEYGWLFQPLYTCTWTNPRVNYSGQTCGWSESTLVLTNGSPRNITPMNRVDQSQGWKSARR